MPQFAFTARDATGRTENGLLDAVSEAELVESLRARGLLTLDVRRTATPEAAEVEAAGRMFGLWRAFPPRSVHVEVSLQQIAFMLRSGLPLLQSIRTCAAQSTRYSMARVWTRVADRIQGGGSFSEALSEHGCFSRLVVTMVGVGEETGVLDQVLVRAATALERRRSLRTGLATAMTYPTIVVLMAVGVVAFIMVSLIPKLKGFLAGFGRELPPMTQLLVDLSTGVQMYCVHALVAVAVAAAAGFAFYSWPPGRMAIDRWLLRVPVFGTLLRIAATATFARSLGTLLASGVRLTEGLRVAEPLHANRYVASRVATTRERVLQGGSAAGPLGEGRAFLPMLSSMVAVGEASGTLDEVLHEVASFHESRLEAAIRRLSTVIEPVIILVVGGIVGFVYLAFFMAIYAIAGGSR